MARRRIGGARSTIDRINVLLICTGNICRSPMAEGLLRRRAEQIGVELDVSSAGLLFEGRAATEEAIEVMADMDVDISAHQSRIIDAEMIMRADLVIGMERLHAREAIVLAPNSLDHTFTLKELVRRGESIGPREHEPVEEWMAMTALGRNTLDLLGESPDDDVADPFRRSAKVYAATAVELEDLVSRLVGLLWGSVPVERPA